MRSNSEALAQFHQARKDGEWGREATMNMIEIFLNPDNSELFAESTEAKGNNLSQPSVVQDDDEHFCWCQQQIGDNTEHIRNAETLIRELRAAGDVSPKLTVLEAYALMATKVKPDIEK
jgi:hypothetical protein